MIFRSTILMSSRRVFWRRLKSEKIDQEDIDFWIKQNTKFIELRNQNYQSGWYEERDLPLQAYFSGKAMDYAGLGRARFLNGNPLEKVRTTFTEAALNIVKCFTMAYDLTDRLYVGDKSKPKKQPSSNYGQVDWAEVGETQAIDGLNYALLGANFEVARQLASWYQDSKDGHKMDPVVNRYIYAYKYALLGELEKGQALLQVTLDEYHAHPPKHIGDINYFFRSMMLQGILVRDEHLFNESLALHLKFYKKLIIPAEDYWGSDEEHISDDAVALSNLAIDAGLQVTVENDLLPPELLIKTYTVDEK